MTIKASRKKKERKKEKQQQQIQIGLSYMVAPGQCVL